MLYNIAICDDSKEDRQRIQDYLARFSFEANTDFLIDEYTDGESLTELYTQSSKRFDIVFLDMEMSGMSGIETAQKIRSLPDRNVLIVFITSYPEYMQDSFDVQASQYLIKPLSYELFKDKLTRIIGYLSELEINLKVFTTENEEYILHLDDIICFETLKNYRRKSLLIVTTLKGELQIKGKISDFESELADKFFISIHRSVLVNMKYIKRFNAQFLEFTTGRTIEMSRRRAAEVKEAFSKYMVMRYRR